MANVGEASTSIDFGQGGKELADSVTVEDDFADVVQGLTDYAENTNNAGVGYTPLGPNSNTFATGVFGSVAGQQADLSNKSYTYPGAARHNTADPTISVPKVGPKCNSCP